jgi:glycosyltransferase involved in cell wall biosynthesis
MAQCPLSVCVLTLNEAHNIAACLATVAEAGELLVGDTGSRDETVAIAQRYASRVLQIAFRGHAASKAELAADARHDWVLSLDADERVTPELWQEIKSLVENSPAEINGMKLRRRSFFLGKKMRAWDDDYQLRLYRKDAAEWNDALIHCGINVRGKVIKSTGYLDHHTDPALRHVLRKMNAYSNANAADLIRAGKKGLTVAAAFFHALSTFARVYVLRGAMWDGKIGFVFACIQALYNWFRYLKAWEIKQGIAPMPGMKDFMSQ